MPQYLIGVDVGTGSARAGVFDTAGTLLATAKRPVEMHREDGGIAEQSSEQVWGAVCASVREAVTRAGIDPADVAGIGFDATCSLVVRGPGGASLPVGDPAHPERDIIVWMDHRAVEQAERINAQGGNAFSDYQVPEAVLMLKQGLGRLIRTATDRGILAILDSRLTTKGYGKRFLSSLPPARQVRTIQEVRDFFHEGA